MLTYVDTNIQCTYFIFSTLLTMATLGLCDNKYKFHLISYPYPISIPVHHIRLGVLKPTAFYLDILF